ncbi:MAG TPA: UDP-galactopyranose mutase, partial [Acidimicrobiales bacterium]|nr:UDP-galactopyranose mutase [Acidimicrobiales bacterium]
RNEPYYPVPAADTRAHYQRYRDLAEANSPGMILAGRLADYRYYNMDQAVNRALVLYRERVAGQLGGRRAVA